MKLSFEEEYRRAMNELGLCVRVCVWGGNISVCCRLIFLCHSPGGLQVVADLTHLDHDMYGMQNDPINMALRRYAGMALTNLTFGDVVNKVQTEIINKDGRHVSSQK